jgi:glycosyltransferase involved in cell wall biosynthesis
MLLRAPIAIVVPVGPYERHRTHLPELVQSIENQTMPPGEVIFVDDGGGTIAGTDRLLPPTVGTVQTRLVRNRWNLGVAASMNVGIGSAVEDLMIMACADDLLLPRCVELCWAAWTREKEPLGYYYLGLRYSNGEEQNTACGAAMVTRALWKYTGGFFNVRGGADDHVFLSALLGATQRKVSRAKILRVSDEVVYWYRQDSNEATSHNIWPAIEAIRDRYTEEWIPPGER